MDKETSPSILTNGQRQDKHKSSRIQPKGRIVRINQPDTIPNITRLLREMRRIPLHNFFSIYYYKYHQFLPVSDVPGGLMGLLKSLRNILDIEFDGKWHYVIPRDEEICIENSIFESNGLLVAKSIPELNKKRHYMRTIGYLFDSNFFLWYEPYNHDHRRLLSKNIIISLSAYETLLRCNKKVAEQQILHFREVLNRYPGIRVEEFANYAHVRLRDLNISCDINTLTLELTEVFYRVPQRYSALLYDGHTKTIPCLDGKDDSCFKRTDPKTLVIKAIKYGVYQKTLLLIREAGLSGLKINVWNSSMDKNFKNDENIQINREEEFKMNTMEFFLALARYDLIEIKSQKACKNDLRAYLPVRKVLEKELKQRLDIVEERSDGNTGTHESS